MRGGGVEAFVEACVDNGDNVGDGGEAVPQAICDLNFAGVAMSDVRANKGVRLRDARAMCRPDVFEFPRMNIFQARQVVAHVSVRRAHDAGGPAHNMIPGK